MPNDTLIPCNRCDGESRCNREPVSIDELRSLQVMKSCGCRDLIAVDMHAQSFFYRHPEIETVVRTPQLAHHS